MHHAVPSSHAPCSPSVSTKQSLSHAPSSPPSVMHQAVPPPSHAPCSPPPAAFPYFFQKSTVTEKNSGNSSSFKSIQFFFLNFFSNTLSSWKNTGKSHSNTSFLAIFPILFQNQLQNEKSTGNPSPALHAKQAATKKLPPFPEAALISINYHNGNAVSLRQPFRGGQPTAAIPQRSAYSSHSAEASPQLLSMQRQPKAFSMQPQPMALSPAFFRYPFCSVLFRRRSS